MFFNDKKKKLSPRAFEQEVEKLVEFVKSNVSPFDGDDENKQAERVRRAREDQEFFNQTYLPHYFPQPSPPFHAEIEELIEEGERQNRPVAVAAPRGHAKSTRITFARALKKTLFNEKKFIIEISDTETQARGFTVSIRVELEHNPRLLHDFEQQKTSQWAAGDFVTASGTRVLARGEGQGIRGLKHGPHRPDLAICDDMENDESVRNPQRVKQTHDWIMEAVVPSLDPAKGVLFIVGTLLSKKSVLAKCLANEAFLTKTYRAIDNAEWSDERKTFTAGAPLWPERFSLEKLARIRVLVGSISFNKEYQNDPRDEDGMFREEWFKRFKWDGLDPRMALYTYQGIDPSLKSGQSNDFKANVTVSRGGDGRLYCRYAAINRNSIDRMVKEAYILHARFNALQIGLEVVGWQELLRRDFDREAEVQKKFLPIVPITRDGLAKESEARIGGLSPLVENGVLVFAEGPESEVGQMEALIEQFQYFPSTTVHDDGPDAAEIAAHLAERRSAGKPSYESVVQSAMGFGAGAW